MLLATLPGSDLKLAEAVANEKLRAAKDLGLMPAVRIYKTRLKGRYVVALGKPFDRSAARVVAAQARRMKLSADAFAEPDAGWELTGTALPHRGQVRVSRVGTAPSLAKDWPDRLKQRLCAAYDSLRTQTGTRVAPHPDMARIHPESLRQEIPTAK